LRGHSRFVRYVPNIGMLLFVIFVVHGVAYIGGVRKEGRMEGRKSTTCCHSGNAPKVIF
jgi:hypothetical protein